MSHLVSYYSQIEQNLIRTAKEELISLLNQRQNVEKQKPIFIEMLNKGNSNILKVKNKKTLEDYPNINLSQFWNNHQ